MMKKRISLFVLSLMLLISTSAFAQTVPKFYQGAFAGFQAAVQTSTTFTEIDNMERGLWMVASATHISLPILNPDADYSDMKIVSVRPATKNLGGRTMKGYRFLFTGGTVPFYVYYHGKDNDGDLIFMLHYKNSDDNDVFVKMVKVVK